MTSPSRDPNRRALRRVEWPADDRLAWEAVLTPSSSMFDHGAHAAGLAQTSLRSFESSYGRLLGILHRAGLLRMDQGPAEHWTEVNLQLLVDRLVAVGCRPGTIVKRFGHLATMLSMMMPGIDTSTITHPRGVPLAKHFKVRTREKRLVPSGDLLRAALTLFQDGLACPSDARRRTMVRNAAIVGLFATRGPRRRAVSEMELGVNLLEEDDTYRVVFLPSNMKMGDDLTYLLPAEIVPIFKRYLAVERMELLGGRRDTAVWVSDRAGRLSANGIYEAFWRMAEHYLGFRLSPHESRHCLTTSAVYESPEAAFEAPLMLGHSPAVSLRHYNRAKGVAATQRHGERMQLRAEKMRALASREYGW